VGVLYDYFVAASDDEAAAAIDLTGAPGGPLPPLPMPPNEIVARYGQDGLRRFLRPTVRRSASGVLALHLKGIDPLQLSEVEELLTDVSYDVICQRPRCQHVVAERDGGEKLVLTINDEMRDALTEATPERLATVSLSWAEMSGLRDQEDVDALEHLLGEFAALAREACAREAHVYCWVCV
jgi:hypothetical protein